MNNKKECMKCGWCEQFYEKETGDRIRNSSLHKYVEVKKQASPSVFQSLDMCSPCTAVHRKQIYRLWGIKDQL